MKTTTIYLIRHSTRFDNKLIKTYKTNQSKKIRFEKIILSVEGEKRAEILSNQKEIENLDVVYASNCVSTWQTAKYILEKQNLKVHIDQRFDERRTGKINEDEVPNWFEVQYKDKNYKTVGGESQLDVRKRFNKAFNEVIEKHKGKRIAIFSHGLAITFFLLKWCELLDVNVDKRIKLAYKDNILIDKVVDAPEVFKLTLNEDNELIEIKNIEFKELNNK